MKTPINLPIARLVGVIETPGEQTGCSLIFVMETDDKQRFNLTYDGLMNALRFAQEQRIISTLSEHWWARIGERNGCSLQG